MLSARNTRDVWSLVRGTLRIPESCWTASQTHSLPVPLCYYCRRQQRRARANGRYIGAVRENRRHLSTFLNLNALISSTTTTTINDMSWRCNHADANATDAPVFHVSNQRSFQCSCSFLSINVNQLYQLEVLEIFKKDLYYRPGFCC